MMTTYRFDEISVKATRKWTDANGKKRQETKTFRQTLNPFNVDKNGPPKTREQIMGEITAQRDAWLEANNGR